MSATIETQENKSEVVATTKWLEFRGSRIHGMGAFARRTIPEGTYVIEYVGEKISKEEAERRCDENNYYIFIYDDEYDLDGSVDWNLARWINHSCEANCETMDDEGHIWIVATRRIQRGEEVSFNYCYDLEEYEDHPCRCGADSCVGFIVDQKYHARVRRKHRAASAKADANGAAGRKKRSG